MSSPNRPSELLPSTRATKSLAMATRSSVEPNTNSPGCSTNASSGFISTNSVRSASSFFTSITACEWLRNTRNKCDTFTSIDDGCKQASSSGSMTIRPAASASRMERSERITVPNPSKRNSLVRFQCRGCSSMAEHQLPKLRTRVRFPSPARQQRDDRPHSRG